MQDSQGFSLTEALIALFLLTTTLTSLLTQQWRTAKLFNDLKLYAVALVVLDNVVEQLYVGTMPQYIKPPFHLKNSHFTEKITWCLSWYSQAGHTHDMSQHGIP